MSSKVWRGVLNAFAIELCIAWAITLFFTDRAGWLAVGATVLFLTSGYMSFCDRNFRDPVDQAYEDMRRVLE